MTQEQTTDSYLTASRERLSRLLRRKSLLVTGGLTLGTLALKVFHLGTEIIDWAHRFEFIRSREGLLFDILRWLLSPTGLNVLLVMAVAATLIAIILIVNPKEKESRSAERAAPDGEPKLEIVCPFDGDQVGFYETVRGYISPPDRELQVLVLAGNDRWYPQGRVSVRGSIWNVKCQFGNRDKPGGSYEIMAVLGNQLSEKSYKVLPSGIAESSRVVRVVRRTEIADEATALDKVFRDMVDADRTDVSRSVFVAARGVDFGPLISENRLDFLFEVFNGSLFPVSISARANGFVNYGGKYLSQYTSFDPGQSDDLQRGKRTVVSFRHEKIAPEKCNELQAEFDAGKALQFDFEGLTLPVRITDAKGTGKLLRLAIPDGINCRRGAPVGYIIKVGVTANLTSDTELKMS